MTPPLPTFSLSAAALLQLESFMAVAHTLRQRLEPLTETINEGGDAEHAPLMAVFDAHFQNVQAVLASAPEVTRATLLHHRTPDDYAIEFGGYLALKAQRMLDANNNYAQLLNQQDNGEDISEEDIDGAHQSLNEASQSLSSGIYEFEKRRDRALNAKANLSICFPWENFPAYLIDQCEGQTITEEGIQSAVADMSKHPTYACALSTDNEQPLNMRLCETQHVRLKPDTLYRFTVDPQCQKCKDEAEYSLGHSHVDPRQ